MINHKIYQGGNYELKNELHSVPRKQQKDFSRHREENWYKVDVITFAAPNLCLHPISNDDEYKIHLSRLTAILTIAKALQIVQKLLFVRGEVKKKELLQTELFFEFLFLYFIQFALNSNFVNHFFIIVIKYCLI